MSEGLGEATLYTCLGVNGVGYAEFGGIHRLGLISCVAFSFLPIVNAGCHPRGYPSKSTKASQEGSFVHTVLP